MESQTKTSYRPPVFVTGVMGGLQSMSNQSGFASSQVLLTSPPGKLVSLPAPAAKAFRS